MIKLPQGVELETLNIHDNFQKSLELVEQGVVVHCKVQEFCYFLYYDESKDSLYFYAIDPKTLAYNLSKADLYTFIYWRNLGNIELNFYHGLIVENIPWLLNELIQAGEM